MTDHKDKPVLDQQNFGKLLEAAHVLQEHNRKMRELEARMESLNQRLREQEATGQTPVKEHAREEDETSRPDDYTLTLAEIVEAQRQIQVRHLELDQALAVIAEKVARITNASGAGIGILDEKLVRYLAGFGPSALPVGSAVPLSMAICCASVRTGQVIRSEDVNTEVLFDPEPCRQREIFSLVAVPIYHDGDIVGGLELYFDRLHGFAEQDIHTCQLLAGLVTEAIGRDSESTLKQSMAAERSSMLAAIERLQPNLASLAREASAAESRKNGSAGSAAAPEYTCSKCGGKLEAEEQFCGTCGVPRGDGEVSTVESNVASARHMQKKRQSRRATPSNGTKAPKGSHQEEQEGDAEATTEAVPEGLLDSLSLPDLQQEPGEEHAPLAARSFAASANRETAAVSGPLQLQPAAHPEAPSVTLEPQGDDLVWSSAAKTRDFLEALAQRKPGALALFWRSRRGDFYLAVALILVLVVIRWGIWSSHSVAATNHGVAASSGANRNQPTPDSNLSAFDKLLISLGLAEAPEPPEYKGNPNTQVWVDLNTALYYCPGAELYGKTQKGKATSQRDAQLDQFEPANRKPCD